MPSTQHFIKENQSLYFTDGGSDKEYHAQLVATSDPDAFFVNFQYGRRGRALQSGTKTTAPLPYDKAHKIFVKLIAEKTAKGYTPAPDGVPFAGTEKSGQISGFVGQLLNAITKNEAHALLSDPDWVAEEKFDGERRSLRKIGDIVEGINRKGLLVALPEPIVKVAKDLFKQCLVDGEIIGNTLYLFDAIELNGKNLRNTPYIERIAMLKAIVPATGAIRTITVVSGTAEKKTLFDEVKTRNGEGIVFKLKSSLHAAGRPNSGGSWLKFKFVASATVIVDAVNDGKRSVSIKAYDENGCLVSIGNVTILPNFTVPKPNDLIEVEYLYAHLGGSLYQTVYKGERNDIDRNACTLSKLKYKPEGEDEDN